MPKACQAQAYHDKPLPIGHDQTISQPYIVAFMTELLKLTAQTTVLEIGTGSGYQTAVCAEIAKQVYSLEIVVPLAEGTAQRLARLGYDNVQTKTGDGYSGWSQYAPFDAIIGTAAAVRIPNPLVEQLKPLGRMVIPREDPDGSQYLMLITKDIEGMPTYKKILPVRFVPMTGEIEEPDDT
jgi:protein-L-isoaspartate(D-aspartate) O-methyltransferase